MLENFNIQNDPCPYCNSFNWLEKENFYSSRYTCGDCSLVATMVENKLFYFNKTFGIYNIEWIINHQLQNSIISKKRTNFN
jgi:hypothetical protein